VKEGGEEKRKGGKESRKDCRKVKSLQISVIKGNLSLDSLSATSYLYNFNQIILFFFVFLNEDSYTYMMES
jgi:hypothetical protein